MSLGLTSENKCRRDHRAVGSLTKDIYNVQVLLINPSILLALDTT